MVAAYWMSRLQANPKYQGSIHVSNQHNFWAMPGVTYKEKKKGKKKVSLKRKSKRGNQKVNHNSQELGRGQQGAHSEPRSFAAASSPAPTQNLQGPAPRVQASSRSSRDNTVNNRQTLSQAYLQGQEWSPLPQKSLYKYFKCHQALSSYTRNKLPLTFNYLDWAINKTCSVLQHKLLKGFSSLANSSSKTGAYWQGQILFSFLFFLTIQRKRGEKYY